MTELKAQIHVEITADQRVKLSKFVDMDVEDYEEYVKICSNTDMSVRERDKAINKLSDKYSFECSGSQFDWGDLEETTFNLTEQSGEAK